MRCRAVGGALIALVAVLAVLAPGTAHAAPAPEDPTDISAKIGPAPIDNQNPNLIPIDVTLTHNQTGKPPVTRYGVFLNARDAAGQILEEEPETCFQQNDVDSSVPKGIYRCAVLVNGPGEWTFVATVNRVGEDQVQRQLLTLETTQNITEAVPLSGEFKGLAYVVEGSTFEVFVLQMHVAVAILWLLVVGILCFIAVPRLRAMMSVYTLQSLEVRRGAMTSTMWVMFGATLISGGYLLSDMVAYDAPFSFTSFSFSDYSDVTSLPYAKWYMNALYLKIVLFFVMGAATVVISAEAARQAQQAQDAAVAGDGDDEPEIDMWSSGVHFDEEGHVTHEDGATGGGTAVTTRRPTQSVGLSPQAVGASVVVFVVGSGIIGACVTILKYTHELIETSNAIRILGG